MKRRNFLKGILGVVGAGVIPNVVKAIEPVNDVWIDQKNDKTHTLPSNWKELDYDFFVASKTGMYDIRLSGDIYVNGLVIHSPPISGQYFYIITLQQGDVVQCDKLYKYNYMKNN